MSCNEAAIHSKIIEELFNLTKDIYIGHDKNLSLVNLCIKFETDWNIGINTEDISIISENDLISEFDNLKSRLKNNDKKFVVLGRTSSGKSTLINALLTENVLYNEFGSTSSCFVEIKGSPYKNRNYLVVNGTERNIEELVDLNNYLSDKCLENGSLITMYYDKKKCQLLADDVTIIDTPGIDTEFLSENSMEDYFMDADVIILVVSSLNGITNSEINLFRKLKTMLTKLNVAIVYNSWDMISSRNNYNLIRFQYIINAKRILCDLGFSDHEAESKIFFISALDRLNIFTNNLTAIDDPKWDERNNEFASLFLYLQTKMSESSFARKFSYLDSMYRQTFSSFSRCQNIISEIKDKKTALATKSKETLKELDNLNCKINSEISFIFNEAYNELIIKGLDFIKKTYQLVNKNKLNNAETIPLETSTEQLVTCKEIIISGNYLEELLHEIVNNSLDTLKEKIRGFILLEDKTIHLMRLKILNEIYFPLYLDLTSQLSYFDINSLERNLLEINKKIRIGKGITIGLTSVVAAAGIATGGAAFAILGLAEAAIVAAGAAGGGAVAGGAIGLGASFGAIQAFKLPFPFAWKENNMAIRNLWNSFESALSNSYSRFFENMTTNFSDIISNIEEKSTKIQNHLNSISEDLNNFQHKS